MPDYKQAELTGTEWQRCNLLSVSNPLGGTPEIVFSEERVVSLATGAITQFTEGCRKQFSAAESFPLLDPATNAPTGQTLTHGELYVALYSLYMQTAAERDAAPGGGN